MSMFTKELLKLESNSVESILTLDPKKQVINKWNYLVIVFAILIENDKILLIREAKKEHHGLLYLPAGKVEKNETLEEAMKRELKEESFIEGEIDHLVSCKHHGRRWLQLNFICHRTGGRLKTKADADKESLEANWYLIDDLLSRKLELRNTDIIEAVHDSINWLSHMKNIQHEKSLPVESHYTHHVQRLFVVDPRQMDNLKVLVSSPRNNFPMNELQLQMDSQISKVLAGTNLSVTFLGVISIEHLPTNNDTELAIAGKHTDGFCFNLLCELERGNLSVADPFTWITASSALVEQFKIIKESDSYVKINM